MRNLVTGSRDWLCDDCGHSAAELAPDAPEL
jgi:hypothetical protein